MSPADALDRVVYLKDRALTESRRIQAYLERPRPRAGAGRRRDRPPPRRRHPAGPPRDRPVHRQGDHPRPRRRHRRLPRRPRGRDGHPAPARGRPCGGPQGRLPQPHHLERRRRVDRGRWPAPPWRSATSTWCVTDHSPAAHHRPRAEPRAARGPARRDRPGHERWWRRSASSPASRSTSSRTAPSTRTRTCSPSLDVVVASVHSKLSMAEPEMTRAHGAGRGQPPRRHPRPLHRPQGAWAAVRAQSALRRRPRVRGLRPLRHRGRDQLPTRAPGPARGAARRWPSSGTAGCRIDTDAHAPGQLEWQVYGCDKAARMEIEPERIVNTMSADDLIAWAASHPTG